MERTLPKYSDGILRLMEMDSEMVTAADIAPVVRMNPQVIVKYAKTGQWPREICNYIVSGSRVKFFRIDLLRKGGWIA
jgi:tRNA(Ile2) C34 agmatinyltransferase TiaS